MVESHLLINESKLGRGPEPIKGQRRAFIGGAVVALLASSQRVMADDESNPNDPFILLLTGIYQPVP